jgi:hypothetical protein
MPSVGRVAIGSLAGAIVAAIVAPLIRGFFGVPTGGVGWVTVNGYPKGWDYAVVALIIGLAFVGGVLVEMRGRPSASTRGTRVAPLVWPVTVIVFFLMLFAHDHPYQLMEPFHEGEHLTPAFQLMSGQRPFSEIFFLHGLGADGGLDALVLGDPPSPQRARRLQSVLDAMTLSLLVPIAAQVSTTTAAASLGALLSLCALAAGQLPKTPYFRLMPILIAALAVLRFVRSGSLRAFAVAMFASTFGVLWSLDFGVYSVAATAATCTLVIAFRVQRPRLGAVIGIAAAAVVAPLIFIVAIRGDAGQFLVDSFVIIPRSIDAIWSVPAPSKWKMESARYYVPLALYGFLLALTVHLFRRGERTRAAQLLAVTVFSIFLFRTAAGRVGWAHTRFALPLYGLTIVAFVIEPLYHARRRVAAIAVALVTVILVELVPNLTLGWSLVTGWRARQRHDQLVRYPLATGKGIYTTEHDARDLAALNGFIESFGPNATFFNFSGERALHYFLQRRPPTRCSDVNMLSAPPLLREAMAQLRANPPAVVVISGYAELQSFDMVPPEVRVPELARWIEVNYPKRTQIGRYVVATR